MKKALVAFVSALALSTAFVGLTNSVTVPSATVAHAATGSDTPTKRDLGWG